MSLTVLTRKRLWGRAGNRCAFPSCRQELIEEAESGHGDVVVGEEAHIVAKEVGGPRGETDLPTDRRDLYENLILLCSRHHIIIDTDVGTYSVTALLDLKAEHEKWVRVSLAPTGQADLERYAEIVDEWSSRAVLDRWEQLFGYVAGTTGPRIPSWFFEQHADLQLWLLKVIWPCSLPDLERAFRNFDHVLADFQMAFGPHAEALDEEAKILGVVPLHRRHRHVDPRYEENEAAYQEQVGLIEDLLLELTRAANHVCDLVRLRLDPQFRLREGALLVRSGPYPNMDERFHRPEYQPSELAVLYPGLDAFHGVRDSRDMRLSQS